MIRWFGRIRANYLVLQYMRGCCYCQHAPAGATVRATPERKDQMDGDAA
jgi:hypothetical protein